MLSSWSPLPPPSIFVMRPLVSTALSYCVDFKIESAIHHLHRSLSNTPPPAPTAPPSPPVKRKVEPWRNVQQNIMMMDKMHEASFLDWIRCEDNAHQAAPHLARLLPEYTADRVANGLRWLFIDWRLITIATLLREVLFDEQGAWLRGDVEEILQRITFDWRPDHQRELYRFLPL